MASRELTQERRENLAYKGQRLYEKSCKLGDPSICAEGFAEHHAGRGEFIENAESSEISSSEFQVRLFNLH